MRIACPACNAAYQVPDEQLREGRVVRCARCGTDWAPSVAIPQTDEGSEAPGLGFEPTEPEPASEPAPPPVSPRRMALDEDEGAPGSIASAAPSSTATRRAPRALAIAWAVSLLIVLGGLVYVFAGRERIMTAWPPSIRAYAAVGLATSAIHGDGQ